MIIHKASSVKAGKSGGWRCIDTAQGIVSSVEGKQGLNVIGQFISGNTFGGGLHSVSSVGSGLRKQYLVVDLFKQNPNQSASGGTATIGSSVGTTTGNGNNQGISQLGSAPYTVTNVGYYDDRIILEKVSINYSIGNGSNIPVKCELYVFTPKTNMVYNDPVTQYDSILQGEGYQYGAFAYGGAGVGNPIAGYPDKGFYPISPLECQSFNKQFKCLKVVKFSLLPGNNVDLKFDLHYNWMVDKNMVTNLPGLAGGDNLVANFPHKSLYFVLRQRGGLIKDTTGSSVVSYGQTQLYVAWDAKYYARMPQNVQNRTMTTLAVPFLANNATTGNQSLIGILDTAVNAVLA